MQIVPIQKNQTSNFQGRLKSNFLPDMLKNFSEKELVEYKALIAKAEKIYLMKTGYDIEKCPKAIVDVFLEPLRKLYSEK
jgi:hypothetical protein